MQITTLDINLNEEGTATQVAGVERVFHRTRGGVRSQASRGVIRGGVCHTHRGGSEGRRKEGAAGFVQDDTARHRRAKKTRLR